MAEQDMTLSVNGQSQVPPGFRFHPTEEELLHYYLRKKVAYQKIDLDVIRDVDLNKLEPWDIQEKCKIGSTPQNDWYFFSHKDKKYPTGTRTNRATAAGFWKATGRDKIIYSGPKRIGLRKTLVFYKGRAPHGQKSDWIMHEYRLDDSDRDNNAICNSIGDSQLLEDGWVVCRVFKKKNYQKSHDSPKNSPTSMDSDTHILSSRNDGVLDQILQYMGRTCKLETESITNISNNLRFLSPNSKNNSIENEEEEQQVIIHHDKSFMHLPRLDSPPTLPPLPLHHETPPNFYHSLHEMLQADTDPSPTTEDHGTVVKLNNWVAFDRLVASQLNGHEEISSKQLSDESNRQDVTFCRLDNDDDPLQLSELRSSRSLMYGNDDNDIWGFTKSSSPSSLDPLSHLSV